MRQIKDEKKDVQSKGKLGYQKEHKGAPDKSKDDVSKHRKDNSDGEEKQTTKKQQNAI
jgi:hypothetical protein